MKAEMAAAALSLLMAVPASAHRLDEYLQATTLAVEKTRVQAEISLSPGVAVFGAVFAELDRDGDGALSPAEQAAYAQRVLADLVLTADARRVPLRLISSTFASIETLREGRGDIRLTFEAELPAGRRDHRLAFENHHQPQISVYLVNALVPREPGITIVAQNRNYEQTRYELDYSDAGAASGVVPLAAAPAALAWCGSVAIALIAGWALLRVRRRQDASAG